MVTRLPLVPALAIPLAGCGLWDSMFGPDQPAPKEVPMAAPPEARLKVTLTVSPLVNPDLDNRASPVVVRFYQLSADDAFKAADFASLFEKDEKTLGPTLLGKAEVIVAPGDIRTVASDINPKALYVAAVVGFRKFETAKWREIIPLKGEKQLELRCNLSRSAVELREDS
jgi:type VI secretion system protein VasD